MENRETEDTEHVQKDQGNREGFEFYRTSVRRIIQEGYQTHENGYRKRHGRVADGPIAVQPRVRQTVHDQTALVVFESDNDQQRELSDRRPHGDVLETAQRADDPETGKMHRAQRPRVQVLQQNDKQNYSRRTRTVSDFVGQRVWKL